MEERIHQTTDHNIETHPIFLKFPLVFSLG